MNQRTLAGFEKYGKVTRRAQFLADMDRVMPWDKLIGLVRPHYPAAGEQGGRPPIPLERMLRVYCLQLWFNLSDPGVEEALYDSDTMRRFVGVDLGSEAPPDPQCPPIKFPGGCRFMRPINLANPGKSDPP